MRWEMGRRSENVEDRRGMRVSRGVVGGGLGGVVLVLVALFFGVDPTVLLNQGSPVPAGPPARTAPASSTPAEDRLADFVRVVLAETEDTWREIFRQAGKTYEKPRLVLFSGSVSSACGFAQAAMRPFYCPADRKVYLDLSFFRELQDRFGAPGDFAQAYVIAHEIGHHVQNLLGVSQKVHSLQSRAGRAEGNRLSVQMELQADCLSGIWAFHADRTRQILDAGDVEEALKAASSIGDDRLQMQARGYVVPDAFTHGTSAQRVQWFRRGIETGSLKNCNTFATARP